MTSRLANMTPIMEDVGRALGNLTEDAFQAEGPGWPQLRPATVKRREAKRFISASQTGAGEFLRVASDDAIRGSTITSSTLLTAIQYRCGAFLTALAPVLDEIQSEHPDKITILKLNVDENPDLAMKYQITSIPAMKVFQGGEVATTIIGAKPKFALEQDLAQYLS